MAQSREFVCASVSEKSSETIVNGPPGTPVETKPVPGVMNGTALARMSSKVCPAGVPQPVQRS